MPILGKTDDLDVLLERCLKRRDAESWARLVDRFQNLVYSIAKRYGLNDDDAGDVFQATFQALYRNLDRIETAKTLPKWLAVTAARESLRIKRISGRTVNAEDKGIDLDRVLADEDQNAEETAVQAERADLVRHYTNELNGKCRDLLTMLYLAEDPSYQEISDSLGMPVGAIGPTRARCLEKLRKKMEEAGFFG